MNGELLNILVKDAFFKKRVKLSSGGYSDYYIDVRRVSLSSRGLLLISKLIWDKIKQDKPTAFGGPTLGADSIVGGVCMCAGLEGVELKGFLVRKEPKKHGNRNLIEGKELTKKDRVVVVDDVVTSGGSIIRAINVLSQNKIKVIKAVAVVDREQGARENFKKLGCDFFALFTKSDLFNAYDQKKK